MDILKRIAEEREREKKLTWQGTFKEYLEIVRQRPKVTQTAHSRVYNMIKDYGIGRKMKRGTRNIFFTREMFGYSDPLNV